MQLRELQQLLLGLYDVDVAEDVRDFLVTDSAWRATGRTGAAEQLLIGEGSEELSLALYLESAVLARVEARSMTGQLEAAHRDEFFLVLEGVSHFNYVAWNATHDKCVTLLELELQAEVDKFVSACVLAGAITPEARNALFAHLFAAPAFDPALEPVETRRYHTANHLAGRYCRSLAERYPAAPVAGMLRELRALYRWPQPAKLSHIHAAVFA